MWKQKARVEEEWLENLQAEEGPLFVILFADWAGRRASSTCQPVPVYLGWDSDWEAYRDSGLAAGRWASEHLQAVLTMAANCIDECQWRSGGVNGKSMGSQWEVSASQKRL